MMHGRHKDNFKYATMQVKKLRRILCSLPVPSQIHTLGFFGGAAGAVISESIVIPRVVVLSA